jgi:ParB-like chromosome segregation protein Spo0J
MSNKYAMKAIADIIPRGVNPRTHSEEQISQLKASINEWGFTNPIRWEDYTGQKAELLDNG